MTRFVGVLIALFLGASAALGQSPNGSEASKISAELARLNNAVREIAELLAKQTEGQKLELLMKRLELASAKVGQLDQRQRSLQSEKANIEDERSRLEARIKEIQNQADTPAAESQRSELDALIQQGEGDLKRLTSRIQTLAHEIGEVDSLLITQRQEQKEWQRLIDRRLGSF